MISFNPEDRYQSYEELVGAFETVIHTLRNDSSASSGDSTAS